MKKKVLLASAILASSIGLTSCGGGGGDLAPTSTSTPAPAPTPTPTPTPTPAAESGKVLVLAQNVSDSKLAMYADSQHSLYMKVL
ncbi:MAG: hypothetical protein ACP5KF_05770 [Sulfurihydrogenibium sp.]